MNRGFYLTAVLLLGCGDLCNDSVCRPGVWDCHCFNGAKATVLPDGDVVCECQHRSAAAPSASTR